MRSEENQKKEKAKQTPSIPEHYVESSYIISKREK
jgi:hypothetical protein